jgi:excinuclease ABC subunit C
MSALPSLVLEKLENLPASPGVYLFKDREGTIVYVGKAKSLKARVRSYFQAGSSDTRYFIPFLHKVIADLDTLVTASEKEALILENNLVKQHQPRFNVKLRDDKQYLSLRLPLDDPWPRLWVVRRPNRDGARYFGPYHSATAARRTLHLVNKHFQLRTCSDVDMAARKRPCLQHQIKRCPAPCVYEVDREWYGEQAKNVALFLSSRHDELTDRLGDQMREAAETLRFELAAVYRDQLRAIAKVREGQRAVAFDGEDRDVIGFFREADAAEIAMIYVRGGRIADVVTLPLKNLRAPDDEAISAFLAAHYAPAASDDEDPTAALPIPKEILLPMELEAEGGLGEWLSELAGHKVDLVVPKRGPRHELVALANENAKHAWTDRRKSSVDVEERLVKLQEKLRLPLLPRRIECIDISHLGGHDTVGAIVAMTDGVPDKKRYRTFHVRGTSGDGTGGDDYAAIYEVLSRRFKRGLDARNELRPVDSAMLAVADSAGDDEEPAEVDADAGWDLPDLFVIDGGKGQLAMAIAAARELGLHDLALCSIAKEKENVAGELLIDRIYLPGQKNPIPVKSTAALLLLAQARDEAHRFSNRARERLGKQKRFASLYDGVKGVGEKTKQALLAAIGGPTALARASDEEVLAVPGVTKRHLSALRAAFPGPVRSRPPANLLEAASRETAGPLQHGPAGNDSEP